MPAPNPSEHNNVDFELWAAELNEYVYDASQAEMTEMIRLMRQAHRQDLLDRAIKKLSIIALGFASTIGYSPRVVDSLATKQTWSEQHIGTPY